MVLLTIEPWYEFLTKTIVAGGVSIGALWLIYKGAADYFKERSLGQARAAQFEGEINELRDCINKHEHRISVLEGELNMSKADKERMQELRQDVVRMRGLLDQILTGNYERSKSRYLPE